MKIDFSKTLEKIGKKNKKIFFLTGDLGFNAFENLMSALGERFINAGVAEQNMVDVAAGMARMGLEPWVYSIAPFLILKSLEQIRNDICHTNLPVRLVGNGGGYGYGIMGESHHMLEDIAILSSFPNMRIFVPAFAQDVSAIVNKIHTIKSPTYLRLNLAPKINIQIPKYSPIRNISEGRDVTVVVLGPLIHNALEALAHVKKTNSVDLWCLTEIPIVVNQKLKQSLRTTEKLMVIEEHTNEGGIGQKILSYIEQEQVQIKQFVHLYARGYPSKRYGSHQFHLKESSLDAIGIGKQINTFL